VSADRRSQSSERGAQGPGGPQEYFQRAVVAAFAVTPPPLREILARDKWVLHETPNAGDIRKMAEHHRVPVVVCTGALGDSSWKDVLAEISSLPCPPRLIVTSEFADDFLWAEVLNLGGFDVLGQPFNEQEVARVLDAAFRKWTEEHEGCGPSAFVERA